MLSELRRLGEAAVGAAQPGGGLDGLEEKVSQCGMWDVMCVCV